MVSATRWCCVSVLAIFSLIGWACLVYAIVDRERLDPLFERILCESIEGGSSGIVIEPFVLGPGNHTQEEKDVALLLTNVTYSQFTQKRCHNPNQFKMELQSVGDGKIYWQQKRTDGNYTLTLVGHNSVTPATLPPEGEGVIRRSAAFHVDMLTAAKLSAAGVITLEFHTTVQTALSFTMLGIGARPTMDQYVHCVGLAKFTTMETGPLDCGSSLGDLSPPALDAPEANISYIEFGEEANQAGGRKRDTYCAGLMVFGIGLGCGCALCSLCICRGGPRRFRLKEKPAANTQVDIAKKNEHRQAAPAIMVPEHDPQPVNPKPSTVGLFEGDRDGLFSL